MMNNPGSWLNLFRWMVAGGMICGLSGAVLSCGKAEPAGEPAAPVASGSEKAKESAPVKAVERAPEPDEGGGLEPEELEWVEDEAREEESDEGEAEDEWPEDEALEGEFAEDVVYDEEVEELAPTTPMEAKDFMDAVKAAVSGGMDPVEVQDILARVPQDPALLDSLKGVLDDPYAGSDMKRYAAAALVYAGTADSVQFVLDELLRASGAGDDDRTDVMVAALESPTTPEGISVLFDFLLGRGAYAQVGGNMQPEAISAARRALLDAADRDAVGDLAVDLYLEAKETGNEAGLQELIDGVAHPYMLARLAASAYEEGQPQDADRFVRRLLESDEQHVVHAVIQLAGDPDVPVEDTAALLFEWSRAHPEEAMPGLFMEYLSDSTQTSAQRGLAAYGLAGTSDPEEARQALEKVLAEEEDPEVRGDIEAALQLLGQEPK